MIFRLQMLKQKKSIELKSSKIKDDNNDRNLFYSSRVSNYSNSYSKTCSSWKIK
nr:DUF5425 family lipoprotein [Borreliella tanukii]